MKIESYDRNVDQLLRMGYFKIPRFQRPYSWERTETEDFWNDTIADAEFEYFIGSIVVFKYSEDVYGIVDGQQRLTTLTMLLSSIRDTLQSEDYANLAKGLHQLIERPDIDNKNQFVLQSESSYPFLQQNIQTYPRKDEETANREEESRLKEAYQFICSNLKDSIEAIRQDKTLSDEKKKQEIKQKLQDVRNKILRLKLIVIILQNEEDAYLIFETLNTRGKDLTVSDMVRTHITRLLPQNNRNVDRPKERFNAILEGFEVSEAEISMSSFLHHYWLSRYEYTTAKKLYKTIKKAIRTRDATKAFLQSLEEDAGRYRTIHEPSSQKWRIEQQHMQESLKALNLFRVRQQVPFVMSVVGEYEEGTLSLKQATRALKAVENFHFAFTAVTSQRSSGGISFMYALHARELRAAKTAQKKTKVIDQLVAKLRSKRPVYQEFEADFRSIGFSDKFTKRKSLAQYILGRMYSHYMPNLPINFDLMTIEHLESQTLPKGSSFSDVDVAEIGNLLFVSEKLNGKLKRKGFAEKMGLLKSSKTWMDGFLSQQEEWTPELIRKRSDFLAKLAYNEVWTF